MELTSENVHQTMLNCLFQPGEDTSNHIPIRGVRTAVGFDPKRVEQNKQNIESMLSYLPNEFSAGGGWTFLNLCNDKYGNQWTGEHQKMDEIVCLGMAIGKVSFLMPREMWDVLPGGVPYISIKN